MRDVFLFGSWILAVMAGVVGKHLDKPFTAIAAMLLFGTSVLVATITLTPFLNRKDRRND